ncbi:predicted protein [Naegleria gruberi]|uniref:Predicted protein n=1 Tax=Naegleria gruberi TaxID=5762 RepID=D2VEB3_NAEGR|nr:uncharacterized protein NAEGRDRAFT_79633 [Naegleria gruberi]EFC44767.1 predicted protein [Naegleria gruberi]|eukprot:XP_002677511.1 predicted protein [Naegleria gruberi strain NEG-M]
MKPPSIGISITNLSLNFDKKIIFEDLDFSLSVGDKVTIVGDNGSGKTTFLRLLSGTVDYSYSGTVEIEGRIGYLPQHFEDIMSDEPTIVTILRYLNDANINQFLEQSNCEKLSSEWYQELNSLGGYEIFKHAHLIGLTNNLLEEPFNQLSGGEKTKTMLCALSIIETDILLLDEPTNHLDRKGIEWLEDFLKEYDGSVIMVTHDRSLINAVSNRISELSPHTKKFAHFRGGYDNYLMQEEKKRLRSIQEREHQDKELKALKQKATQLKSNMKEKKIRESWDRDKISHNNQEQRVQKGTSKAFNRFTRKQESITENMVEIIPERAKISFEFDDSNITTNLHILVSNLSKSFGDKLLFRDLSFTLVSGDRMIVQGPNGSGKTTLFRIIMDLIKPDEGTKQVSNSARIGYLDQEQESLPLDKTAVELLMEDPLINASKKQAINNLCNYGVYTWQDLNNTLRDLSIGCRRKVQLCQIVMRKCSILLLDEPTNHIDFPSLEVIEEALMNFPGVIIAATHDRYFIEKVGTEIINLTDYNGSKKEEEDNDIE